MRRKSKSELSPWPVRLLVYVILVVVALLAIRVIDDHAMSKQAALQSPPQPQARPQARPQGSAP